MTQPQPQPPSYYDITTPLTPGIWHVRHRALSTSRIPGIGGSH
jgi:hypothetical protein